MPHSHPCHHCGAPTECGGVLEQNYDGIPEVICTDFHRPGGETDWTHLCALCASDAYFDDRLTGDEDD